MPRLGLGYERTEGSGLPENPHPEVDDGTFAEPALLDIQVKKIRLGQDKRMHRAIVCDNIVYFCPRRMNHSGCFSNLRSHFDLSFYRRRGWLSRFASGLIMG